MLTYFHVPSSISTTLGGCLPTPPPSPSARAAAPPPELLAAPPVSTVPVARFTNCTAHSLRASPVSSSKIAPLLPALQASAPASPNMLAVPPTAASASATAAVAVLSGMRASDTPPLTPLLC
eukprot:COSAG01_NODE_667_length_14389_cov_5.828202_1_plen_122_part_00